MSKRIRVVLVGGFLLSAVVTLSLYVPAGAAPHDLDSTRAIPVEPDMHEFMEYVFEPPYKRLKAGLAAEPADRAAWKGIKSDSLILAESANLLLHRSPENHADQWNKHAQAVRTQGGQLYQAAKKRDFDSTRKNFSLLLQKCNNCHTQFADGKHQLAP